MHGSFTFRASPPSLRVPHLTPFTFLTSRQVTIPIKEISHIVRLQHDSHGLFVKLNPAVFPEALQKIATPEVHKMLDARVILVHVSFAARIRHAFGEDKCGRVERYEAK